MVSSISRFCPDRAFEQRPQNARLHGLFEEPERFEVVDHGDGFLDAAKARKYDGRRAVASLSRLRSSPNPSIRGIIRSVTMTSAGDSVCKSLASWPSDAVEAWKPKASIMSAISARWASSSSTTRTRIDGILVGTFTILAKL